MEFSRTFMQVSRLQLTRSSVFKISLALGCNVSRNSNRGTAVCDARREGADVAGLMLAGESQVVVLTIDLDVLGVTL